MTDEMFKFQTNDYGMAKSSLMILASNEDLLKKKVKKYKSFPKYLRFLIKRYGIILKNDHQLDYSNTKKYQTRGLNYARIKFEVDGNTWMSYQLLAFYHRVSISYLFALLFSWDSSEEENEPSNKSIVTVHFLQIQMYLDIFSDNFQDFDYECLLKLKT